MFNTRRGVLPLISCAIVIGSVSVGVCADSAVVTNTGLPTFPGARVATAISLTQRDLLPYVTTLAAKALPMFSGRFVVNAGPGVNPLDVSLSPKRKEEMEKNLATMLSGVQEINMLEMDTKAKPDEIIDFYTHEPQMAGLRQVFMHRDPDGAYQSFWSGPSGNGLFVLEVSPCPDLVRMHVGQLKGRVDLTPLLDYFLLQKTAVGHPRPATAEPRLAPRKQTAPARKKP